MAGDGMTDDELITRVREADRNWRRTFTTCPCGAWLDRLAERPHVIACPVETFVADLDTLARRLETLSKYEEVLRKIASHERPEDAYVLDTAMRLWKRSAAEYFQELARKALLHPEPQEGEEQ